MATVSRACHITNTNRHELDKTIDIYRRAVNYIIDIVILRYDDIMKITGDEKVPAQKKRMAFVEGLIHTTKKTKPYIRGSTESSISFSYISAELLSHMPSEQSPLISLLLKTGKTVDVAEESLFSKEARRCFYASTERSRSWKTTAVQSSL